MSPTLEDRRAERVRQSVLTGSWCSSLGGGAVCFLCGHDNSAQWAPFRSYLIRRVAICNQCTIGLTMGESETVYRCDHCNLYADAKDTMSGEGLRQRRECFNCNHWLRLLRSYPYPKRTRHGGKDERGRPDTSRAFVINGTHYMLDTRHPIKNGGKSKAGLGFGGSMWHVRFDDGTEVRSNDVWCQGTVPDLFRDRFPDNATIAGAHQ